MRTYATIASSVVDDQTLTLQAAPDMYVYMRGRAHFICTHTHIYNQMHTHRRSRTLDVCPLIIKQKAMYVVECKVITSFKERGGERAQLK